MLTRERVLAKLAIDGEMYMGKTAIYKYLKSPGGFLCAEDIYVWIVKSTDGTKIEYADIDIISAVDYFITCQSTRVNFPDADELRILNKQVHEAAYKQWCEEHAHELVVIADGILLANKMGKRTIEFDVPRNETEGNYRRYFTERHYEVVIQRYSDERVEKRGLALCRLSWSETFKRKR